MPSHRSKKLREHQALNTIHQTNNRNQHLDTSYLNCRKEELKMKKMLKSSHSEKDLLYTEEQDKNFRNYESQTSLKC